MTWSLTDIPSQDGRVAVVTGANGGLGLATARALATSGAHVVMAARNQAKATAARDEILTAQPDASVEIVELDLSAQASVKEAAAAIAERHDAIDLLINNAGVMAMPEGRTADGFETQLGTNHLGHWTLTSLLLPAVQRAPRGRVVTLSSIARFQGRRLDPNNPHLEGRYSAWRAYGNSKLANLHVALGLNRLLSDAGSSAIALSAHPGITYSDLQATTADAGGGGLAGRLSDAGARRAGMSVTYGSLSQLRAATDPSAPGGTLYGPAFGTFGPPIRKPLPPWGSEAAIRTLWDVSRDLTGVDLAP